MCVRACVRVLFLLAGTLTRNKLQVEVRYWFFFLFFFTIFAPRFLCARVYTCVRDCILGLQRERCWMIFALRLCIARFPFLLMTGYRNV